MIVTPILVSPRKPRFRRKADKVADKYRTKEKGKTKLPPVRTPEPHEVLMTYLQQRKQLVFDLLDKLDKNHDGSLTKEELASGLQMMGLRIDDVHLDMTMRRFDKDNSGSIDLREFTKALVKPGHRDKAAEKKKRNALSIINKTVKNGIEELPAELIKHAHRSAFAENGLLTMCKLSAEAANARSLGEGGGVEAILAIMSSHANEPQMQQLAVKAFGHLCSYPDNRRRVLMRGGVDATLSAMRAFKMMHGLQASGCWTLKTIAMGSEELKIAVNEKGAETAVLNVLRNHRGHVETVHEAKEALKRLQWRERLGKPHAGPLFPRLMISVRETVSQYIISHKELVLDLLKQIDTNHDGRLASSEFRAGLQMMGLRLQDEELDLVMRALDKNGDGTISAKELENFLNKKAGWY